MTIAESRALDVVECVTGESVALLPEDEAIARASVLKALADPVRLRLMHYIAAAPGGTACACALPDALGIAQPTMSHHLAKLVDAGLLARERRGRWAHYTIVRESIRGKISDLMDLLDPPTR